MTCFVYISGQRMDGQSRELREMYLSQLMTDVIIECIDGSVMAHKLVLSSLSQRLYQLLSKWSTSQLIVIILMDTKVDDMKSIVDCVYFGHQLVDIKRVNQLQQIANTFGLQLKTEEVAEESLNFSRQLIQYDINGLMRYHSVNNNNNNSLIASDRKRRLKDKPIEPMDLSIDQLQELPINLSLSSTNDKTNNEDNIMKTIESIVANGPSIAAISQPIGRKRRRKQSYPKTVVNKNKEKSMVASKHLNVSSNASNTTKQPEDSVELLTTNNAIITPTHNQSLNVLKEVASMSFGTYLSPQIQPSMEPIVFDVNMDSVNDNNNSQNMDKEVVDNQISKENIISTTTQLPSKAINDNTIECSPIGCGLAVAVVGNNNSCPVCLIQLTDSKELISHLNAEHKTNGRFKCFNCGKEQKYAKTLIKHSTNCRQQLQQQNPSQKKTN
ncbi:uncharacterized protein LOC128962052 [Oppia nitens]|uniref:uncharacterized protein LOC128962052 n=1 Tax=Oppia nitens TaxID=1686743 RepID=UPI0023DAD88A|nr:uncharacterized protein LOC128962052 [Oppia nitens]